MQVHAQCLCSHEDASDLVEVFRFFAGTLQVLLMMGFPVHRWWGTYWPLHVCSINVQDWQQLLCIGDCCDLLQLLAFGGLGGFCGVCTSTLTPLMREYWPTSSLAGFWKYLQKEPGRFEVHSLHVCL